MDDLSPERGGHRCLADFLDAQREAILAAWEARARKLRPARELERPALRDHLPRLLERIARVVRALHGAEPVELADLPDLHALDRLDLGYDLHEAALDLALLRDTVFELWTQEAGATVPSAEARAFNTAVDEILVRSVERFARTRERTLRALDRVSTAALGTGEPDTFLPELLRAVLENTEAADAAAVLLVAEGERGPALELQAALGLPEAASRSLARPLGEGFCGRVATGGEPLLVRDAATAPLVESAALRAAGLHALYGVPLRHAEAVIGVALMGSRTAFDLSEEDRQVFRSMVQRATALIVQRRLAERIRQSEAAFRLIARHSPDISFVQDRELRYTWIINPAAPLDEQRVLGRSDYELLPPEEAERIAGLKREVMASGRRRSVELELSPRGEPRFYDTTYEPWRDARGEIAGVVSYSRDVTERKEAELRQAELLQQTQAAQADAQRAFKKLDAVYAAAPIALGFLNAELRFSRANEALAQISGRPVAEHRGLGPAEALAGELGERLERLAAEVRDSERPVWNEELSAELPALPGQRRRWLANVYPVLSPGGERLGVGLALLDVTEQAQLLESLQAALRERERAVDVLEHGDACFVLDRDFRFVLVNRNQERIGHTRREETLGRVFWDVFPEAARPDSRYWVEYHRVMRERVESEFQEYYAPLGVWTDVRAYPTKEGGIAVFFFDATERKRAELFQERLLGIVGHDLRNPLGAISLSARVLLQRGEQLPGFAQAAVRRISRSADRMANMISQLLDFTRARLAGGIALEPVWADLCDAVRQVVEELEVAYPGRLRLWCAGPVNGLWDPERLAQVVSNLVANALKHGAPDRPVGIRVEREGGEALIEVRNEGPPIPGDLVPLLFDPFRRTAAGVDSGLGLGLYIAEHIVSRHGGRIEVRSSEAEGTVFTVRLPLREGGG